MHIHVRLSTTLRDLVPDYDPETGVHAEAPDGASAADLARSIGIPPEDVKIVMINGRQRPMDSILADGDRVAYFPPVGGG